MERRLKERLTGAAVLVMIAVIFIPMVLDNSGETDTRITTSNIPPRPDGAPRSRIIPIEPPALVSDQVPPANNVDTGPLLDAPDPPEMKETVTQEISEPGPGVAEPAAVEMPAPPPTISPQPPAAAPRGMTAWVVQLGSFSSQVNAEALVARLQQGGYPAYIEEITSGNSRVYRVRVGPELVREDVDRLRAELEKKFSLQGIVQTYP